MNALLARATLMQIEALCLAFGPRRHIGAWEEASIGLLDHALQCAQLAEWAHAEPSLVAAAFLHDLGHALAQAAAEAGEAPPAAPGWPQPEPDPSRPYVALLAQAFDETVTEPIRLHGQAKRYLVSTDARYAEALSVHARARLVQQGGLMGPEERRRFEAEPHADAAIRLRLWDDLAKHPGKTTPPLAYYLDLLAELIDAPTQRRKLDIGSLTLA
jgi:predicted HD phosphohydrolase